MSLQKAKDNEFIGLQQGRMSILAYTSKFREISRFAPTYVANEKLNTN